MTDERISMKKITMKSLREEIRELKEDMEAAGVKKRKKGNWFQRLNAWRKTTCLDEMIFVCVATTVIISFLAINHIWPY